MEEKAEKASKTATFFNVVERGSLFGLSAAVGVVDLTIALFIAYKVGLLPKKPVDAAVASVQQKIAFLRPGPRPKAAAKPATKTAKKRAP